MSGFLHQMGVLSRARADLLDRAELSARASALPPPTGLDKTGFGVIAEVKFSAPSSGVLREENDPLNAAVERALVYEAAGARAISVLTEPSRFSGDLSHLAAVSAAVDLPVMRKDFLVDPVQVLEARVYGAAGVLLIVRMLDDSTLKEMVEQAHALGMFVLLEAFDQPDLQRTTQFDGALIGLNCRDLQTLEVEPARFKDLAGCFPSGQVQVAESGLASVDAVEAVVGLGYGMVLVGSALMRADDPGDLLRAMTNAGRGAA